MQMKLQNFSKKDKSTNITVIGIIILIYFLLVFFESLTSKYPHGTDCFTHYYELLHIKQILLEGFNSNNLIGSFNEAINFVYFDIRRPPIFYILTLSIDILITNLYIVAHYIVPFFYFIITIIFTFKTSEHIVKKSGIFAVLVLSLFPVTGEHISGISMYPGLIAIVICSFYYFFKSNFFENKKYSIIFGFIFGLGLLTKEQFLLFFVGPFIIIFFNAFTARKKMNWSNFVYFVFIAFLIGFLPFTIFHVKTYICHEPFRPSLSNISFQIFYYCKGIFDDLGLPLAIIFLFTLFAGLLKKQGHMLIFLFSWLFFVIIGSLFEVRGGNWFQWYYISPAIPGFAIIIGTYLKKFPSKTFAILLLIAILINPALSLPYKNHFGPYQTKTFAILHYLKKLGNNIPKEKLAIGLMRDSWECVLPSDLEVFLKADGYDKVIGGHGFPNIDMLTSKMQFDIFLYVTKDKGSFWITENKLQEQVDSLLPELKNNITHTDIERLLKRKKSLTLTSTFNYFYNNNHYLVYCYVNN